MNKAFLRKSISRVLLIDRYGEIVDRLEWPGPGYEGDRNVSMVRLPDITGDWANSLPPLDPYSPGRSNESD